MRRSARILLFLFLINILTPLFVNKAYSGDLTSTFLRLDRQKVSTSTGGQICTTTPSSDNGTEMQVQIIFPSSFTVNASVSNWTVTTSDIPSTATPWPGIATATSVSGQTVTFPSSNLAVNTQYCFNFSSVNTLTTPSSTGSYEGTIRTRDASNTTIDSIDYGISVISNDQITVTATVPANPTDFEAEIALIDPANGTFDESTTLTYRITYGSLLNHAASITVEAEWDLGTIQGSGTPTEDILDYVIGSASDAYNSTPPVIDTVNRKITWEITTIPANTTDQTVTFKLATNDSYKGGQKVDFSVNGRVLGPGTQTADSTVTSTYQYLYSPTSTPTPTCVPGSCPTSTPAPTLTPTPTAPKPVLTDIDIRTISATGAAVYVSTNKNTTVRLNYGVNLNALNKTVRSTTLSTSHLLRLTDLRPKTRYYFRVIVTDANGNSTTSDFYLLDTAAQSTPPRALTDTLIVTSGDVVLTNPLRMLETVPNIVIPARTSYAFRFGVMGYEDVKSIKVFIRDNNVLGINTDVEPQITNSLNITEISPGQYIGKLTSSPDTGTYKIVLQIQDFSGNITEQSLGTIYVVKPLTILNAQTKKGVENARVTFYYYNSRLRTYEKIGASVTPIKNPSFSEFDGSVGIVLPEGKYKAEVETLGYETKTVEFEVASGNSSYPVIELKSLPFNAATYLKYSVSTAMDVAKLLQEYIHTLRTSVRFFDFIAFITIVLFISLGMLAAANRLNIPLQFFPFYLLHIISSPFRRNSKDHLLRGSVTTTSGDIIAGAIIYALNSSGKIISHTRTSIIGEFILRLPTSDSVKLRVNKIGYEHLTKSVNKSDLDGNLNLNLEPTTRPKGVNFQSIYWYFNFFLDSIFEALLIVTLLIELVFVLEFGWWKVLPFILVSLGNMVIFAVHARNTRST